MLSKLNRILKGIKLWIISCKTILTSKEAAIYLKTDVITIYRLTDRYHLPAYKTQKQLLYFKRKEIDAWLKPRRRKDLPQTLRETRKSTMQDN